MFEGALPSLDRYHHENERAQTRSTARAAVGAQSLGEFRYPDAFTGSSINDGLHRLHEIHAKHAIFF